MTDPTESPNKMPGQQEVRPVGTWIVAGFVFAVCAAIWLLVAVIFSLRT